MGSRLFWLLYLLVICALVANSITREFFLPDLTRADTVFNSLTISNGFNRLRGQSLEQDWPSILERFFFGKTQYLPIVSVQILDRISASNLFGGVHKFPIPFAAPFLLGIYQLWRSKFKYKRLLIIGIVLLVSYQGFFYPDPPLLSQLLLITLIGAIISLGMSKLKLGYLAVLMILVLMEILI